MEFFMHKYIARLKSSPYIGIEMYSNIKALYSQHPSQSKSLFRFQVSTARNDPKR